jgi:hypothetical protein
MAQDSEGLTPGSEPKFAGKVIPVNAENKKVNRYVNDKSTDFYQQQIIDQEKIEEEDKMLQNVKLFEFYLAGNFYEDNISTVEI